VSRARCSGVGGPLTAAFLPEITLVSRVSWMRLATILGVSASVVPALVEAVTDAGAVKSFVIALMFPSLAMAAARQRQHRYHQRRQQQQQQQQQGPLCLRRRRPRQSLLRKCHLPCAGQLWVTLSGPRRRSATRLARISRMDTSPARLTVRACVAKRRSRSPRRSQSSHHLQRQRPHPWLVEVSAAAARAACGRSTALATETGRRACAIATSGAATSGALESMPASRNGQDGAAAIISFRSVY